MSRKLYFFKSGDRIKIGISKNVPGRLKVVSMNVSDPISVIGCIPGSFALERHIHQILADHRATGEWFDDCPRVREVINLALDKGEAAFDYDRSSPATRQQQTNTLPLSHEDWLRAINGMVRTLYPENTIAEMAAFHEVSDETVNAWLSGDIEMPQVHRAAFSAVLMQAVFKDLAERRAEKSRSAA